MSSDIDSNDIYFITFIFFNDLYFITLSFCFFDLCL